MGVPSARNAQPPPGSDLGDGSTDGGITRREVIVGGDVAPHLDKLGRTRIYGDVMKLRPRQTSASGLTWHHRQLSVSGLTFRLKTSQTPDAQAPFVLVHGIGMPSRYLTRLGEQLAAAAPIVLVEIPGHAGLPKPDPAITITAMSVALGSVLDEIGVREAVLVGHSMGSQWVVELAASRPDLEASVVVIGPVTDERRRSVLAHLVSLARDTLRETPAANTLVVSDYLRCGISSYRRHLRHMMTYPIESRVADLTTPLLIIRGQHDPIAGRRWCQTLQSRATNATLVEIPAAGHLAQHTTPGALAEAILNQTPPPRDRT